MGKWQSPHNSLNIQHSFFRIFKIFIVFRLLVYTCMYVYKYIFTIAYIMYVYMTKDYVLKGQNS